MIYMIDIDGTIFNTNESDYDNSTPIISRIEHFNKLYDDGHIINYWTARGANTGKNWHDFTIQQLKNAGAKFHSFNTGKPSYDLWIDDKCINVETYFNKVL